MWEKGLLAVAVCALLVGCGSDNTTATPPSTDVEKSVSEPKKEPEKPTSNDIQKTTVQQRNVIQNDFTYKIIAYRPAKGSERFIEIELSKRLSKEQLLNLSKQITSTIKDYDFVRLVYYVPDKKNFWGLVLFNIINKDKPELLSFEMGNTQEEQDKLQNIKPNVKGKLLGTWYQSENKEYKIILEKLNNKVFLRLIYPDGERKPVELITRHNDYIIPYGDERDEYQSDRYYFIDDDGNLHFRGGETRFIAERIK